MNRTPVNSSTISSIGHDASTNTLEVEFKNGSVYHYRDVTPEKAKALMEADSVGKHFSQHIRTPHPSTKVQ